MASLSTWNKVIGGVLAALASIAGIIAVLPIIFEPRADLQVTYRQVPFALPAFVQGPDFRDSSIVRLNGNIDSLYNFYDRKQTPLQSLSQPASMRPSSLKEFGLSRSSPVKDFAQTYSGLLLMTIRNDGKKAVSGLKVVYPGRVYYQYRDAQDTLHTGQSKERFLIGRLDAHESRQVMLWTSQEHHYSHEVVEVVHDDGAVQAVEPVEVTGKTAWLVENGVSIIGYIAIFLTLLPPLLATAKWIRDRNTPAAPEAE